MKNIELKGRKFLRRLFGCLSFTAVAFAFQACYGVGRPPFYDVKLTGTVRSKATNTPIKGIKIIVNEGYNGESVNEGTTDKNGHFDFFASISDYGRLDSLNVHFVDIDGAVNGYFENKTITIRPAYKEEVKIYVDLEYKKETI